MPVVGRSFAECVVDCESGRLPRRLVCDVAEVRDGAACLILEASEGVRPKKERRLRWCSREDFNGLSLVCGRAIDEELSISCARRFIELMEPL